MIKKIGFIIYLFISSILFSIILVLNSSILIHELFVKSTNLNLKINLSSKYICSDYKNIINYLRFPWINNLELDYFSISNTAYIHFQEVKNIFSIIFIIAFIIIFISIILYYFYEKSFFMNLIKNFNYYFYFIILFIFILFISLFTNFSSSFTIFHNILFNNNYWIFNPIKDSVILIFPEEFFMICVYFILVIILLISFILKLYYHKIKIKKGF